MVSAWDCFGSDEENEATRPAAAAREAAPRASTHSHFGASRAMWAAGRGSSAADRWPLARARAELVADLRSRGVDAARALRAHAPYGPSCGKCLRTLASMFDEGVEREAERLRAASEAARGCLDLCLSQLEEGDWPDGCWQTASLFALGVQLCCVLAALIPQASAPTPSGSGSGLGLGSAASLGETDAEGGSSAEVQTVGRLALWLFASALTAKEESGWCGALIREAEARVAAACALGSAPYTGATYSGGVWGSAPQVDGASIALKFGVAPVPRDLKFGADFQPFLIPASVHLPTLDPARAVSKVNARELKPAAFYSKFVLPKFPAVRFDIF